jgi:hypothetical protein
MKHFKGCIGILWAIVRGPCPRQFPFRLFDARSGISASAWLGFIGHSFKGERLAIPECPKEHNRPIDDVKSIGSFMSDTHERLLSSTYYSYFD